MSIQILLSAALLCLSVVHPLPQVHPDFSGTWTFDRVGSSRPGPDGRIVIAPILGDEFLARQDSAALTLTIKVGELQVVAVYNFQGESRNVSPAGPGQAAVPVTSRVEWTGDTLVILSSSTSSANGSEVRIDSRRVIWLDDGGDTLVIERTGTPAAEVTRSRSVYRRVRAPEKTRAMRGAPVRAR